MLVTAGQLYTDDVPFQIDGGHVLYRTDRSDSAWRTSYNAQYARLARFAREDARRALELEGFDEDLWRSERRPGRGGSGGGGRGVLPPADRAGGRRG